MWTCQKAYGYLRNLTCRTFQYYDQSSPLKLAGDRPAWTTRDARSTVTNSNLLASRSNSISVYRRCLAHEFLAYCSCSGSRLDTLRKVPRSLPGRVGAGGCASLLEGQ